MRCVRRFLIGVALLAAAPGDPALSQDADVVLLNGKIVPLGAPPVESLAVRDGKIVQLGRSGDIARLAGTGTRVIDLGGRTVIPGLIDSHMHAIRTALFYATEVNWIGAGSIPEAMARIAAAARRGKPGQWIIVAGGWTEQQFAELVAAAPNR